MNRLRTLMGDDLAARITGQGIDLDAVTRQARRRGYAPTELFRLEEPNREIVVRLQ